MQSQNDRSLLKNLTIAYKKREIGGEELIDKISNSYHYHEEVALITEIKPGQIHVVYNNEGKGRNIIPPLLHAHLGNVGWKTSNLQERKLQNEHTVDRDSEERTVLVEARYKTKIRRPGGNNFAVID